MNSRFTFFLIGSMALSSVIVWLAFNNIRENLTLKHRLPPTDKVQPPVPPLRKVGSREPVENENLKIEIKRAPAQLKNPPKNKTLKGILLEYDLNEQAPISIGESKYYVVKNFVAVDKKNLSNVTENFKAVGNSSFYKKVPVLKAEDLGIEGKQILISRQSWQAEVFTGKILITAKDGTFQELSENLADEYVVEETNRETNFLSIISSSSSDVKESLYILENLSQSFSSTIQTIRLDIDGYSQKNPLN